MAWTETEKSDWTIPEACEVVGVKQSQVHKWLREGVLKPYKPAPEKGKPNKFNYNDLLKLSVLNFLGKMRLIGKADKKWKVAGYLIGNMDLNRHGAILRIGPDPNSKSAWTTYEARDPKEDEMVVISINLELFRNRIDSNIKRGL